MGNIFLEWVIMNSYCLLSILMRVTLFGRNSYFSNMKLTEL